MNKTKKILTILLALSIFACTFGLIACDKFDEEAAKSVMSNYIFDQDDQTVAADFVLPKTLGGFPASWTSSNSNAVKLTERDEDFLAEVIFPESEQVEVTLTVSLSEEISKSFKVRVNPIDVYNFSAVYNFVNDKKIVTEDFDLDTKCTFKGKEASITWSVLATDGSANYISINDDGNKCIVKQNSMDPTVTLCATFSYKGETTTKRFKMTVSVPKTHRELVDNWYGNTGISLDMSGYVVGIGTVYSADFNNVTLYVVDDSAFATGEDQLNAGYYLYRVKTDDANAALLVPGAHVTVTGTTNTNYNGLIETNAGGNLVVDSNISAKDMSSVCHALDNEILSGATSTAYNESTMVSLSGWTVKSIASTVALSGTATTATLFTLTNGGVDVTVAISKYMEGFYSATSGDATAEAIVGLQSSLKAGDIVNVKGILGCYNGTFQIVPCSANDVTKVETAVTYADAAKVKSAIAANVATLKTEGILTSAGKTALVVEDTEFTLPATIGDVAVSYKLCSTPSTITLSEGKFTITPATLPERVHVQCEYTCGGCKVVEFFFIEDAIKSDTEKVADEKEALKVAFAKIEEDGEFDLPVASIYKSASISWALEGTPVTSAINGGKLVVTLGEDAEVIKLIATITAGDASDTKEFTVNVDAAVSDLYLPEYLEAVPTKAFKFAFYQPKLDGTFYLTGEQSGTYLASTDKPAKGMDFIAEAVMDGEEVKGYNIYFMAGETKTYLVPQKVDGKTFYNKWLSETPATETLWQWDDTLKTFTFDGSFLGTKKTNSYSTLQGAKDAEQYCYAKPAKLVPADFQTTALEAVPAKAFKFAFYQPKLDGMFYLTGEQSGTYLASTDKPAKGMDFIAEAVMDGEVVKGYNIYFMAGETKTYLVPQKVDGKTFYNKWLSETASTETLWQWDDTLKTFTFDGSFLGTKKTNSYSTLQGAKDAEQYCYAQPSSVALAPVEDKVCQAVPTGAFKFTFYQPKLDGTFYLTGEQSGTYLASTDKYSKSMDFIVEAVMDGETVKGYNIYFMAGETKTYLVPQKVDGKTFYNKWLSETPATETLWQWDDTLKTFTFDGSFLGTKKTNSYSTLQGAKDAEQYCYAQPTIREFVTAE